MTATSIDDQADALRRGMHGMWDSVAPAWGEQADFTDERAARVHARLLDLAEVGAGDRVLELACGSGGLGRAAAGRGARVTVSDVAPEMVRIAADRAAAHGVPVTAAVRDLEAIDEPDGAFYAVLAAEGLMFALDPVRAAREMRRVLAPGGRVAVAVWAERESNPWLGLVMDAVTAQTGREVPPLGMPGPFALAQRG